MAEQSLAHPFVLGFVGDQEVHRDNTRALLRDLIGAYVRQNKGAEVRFVLPAEPYTDTMDELANFCYTSGYQLEYVSHDNVIPGRWEGHAGVSSVPDEVSLWSGVVSLLAGEPESRLILLADPNVDDPAYGATFTALNKNVKVRSLLHGLDIVLFRQDENDEAEEEPDDMPRDEEYDEVDEAEDYDDETEDDVEDEVDEDEESEEEDDDEESDEAEDEVDDAVEDEAEDEDLGDEEESEPEVEDEADDDDEEPEEEPEEEEVPATAAVRRTSSGRAQRRTAKRATKRTTKKSAPRTTTAPAPERLTRNRLERMAERDRPEFLSVARSYGITPGRGIKISTMVNRILEAQDNGKVPRRMAKKAVAKTTATRKPTATVKKRAAISSNSKGAPSSVVVKAAVKAAQAFLDVVEAGTG